MSFAKESWLFVLPFLGLAVLLALLRQPGWATVAVIAAVCLLLFFRVPRRRFEGADDAVLSPANGKVLRIDRVEAPDIGPGSFQCIVIFLSVFNVHVQRAPVSGRVSACHYEPGRKLAAFDPRAGEVNEQQLTVIEDRAGNLVGIRQIAGLLARRVVTFLEPGQTLDRGELIGLIKFGSRVDLLLPLSYHLRVEPGQKVREGESVVALHGDR